MSWRSNSAYQASRSDWGMKDSGTVARPATARAYPSAVDDARKATSPIKGRGSASRVAGRFEKTVRHGEDDGWGSVYDTAPDGGDALPVNPDTQVTEERARSIISRNQSPDVGFNASINPY